MVVEFARVFMGTNAVDGCLSQVCWLIRRYWRVNFPTIKTNHSEFDMMMVQFMGQHTSLLNDLVHPPHNLFATLASLTMKIVSGIDGALLIPQTHSTSQLVALTMLPLHNSVPQNQQQQLQNYEYFVSQWLSTGNIMLCIGTNEATNLARALSPSL